MRNLYKQATRLLAAGLLLSGLSAGVFAQSKEDDQKQQADRQKTESTMTGCLTKDASGAFVLTDEKTGAKSMVTGAADLEKHAANHKVTLIGTPKTDSSGKQVFEVSKIEHVSPDCKAPSQ